jgi:hypothetical protein
MVVRVDASAADAPLAAAVAAAEQAFVLAESELRRYTGGAAADLAAARDASARSTDRFIQYLRGDGPGGRSAGQL